MYDGMSLLTPANLVVDRGNLNLPKAFDRGEGFDLMPMRMRKYSHMIIVTTFL